MPGNNVRKIREALMMSKAELARKAGLSTLTIDRVEAGKACRLDTKRKILHALGMKVGDREEVFATGAATRAGATSNTPTNTPTNTPNTNTSSTSNDGPGQATSPWSES